LRDLAQRAATFLALVALCAAFVCEVRPAARLPFQDKKPPKFDVSWKPPDTDAKLSSLTPYDTCPTAEIMAKAGARAGEIVDNLAKFDAVETGKRVVLDENGFALTTQEQDFDYQAEIIHSADTFRIKEARTSLGDERADALRDSALAAMVILLHPSHQSDFEFQCEGRADWQGHPSFVVSFAQRDGVPSRVLSVRTERGEFPVPLKGRVWVTVDGYQTVHLETNRQHPIRGLPLVVDSISADYAPVHFASTNSDLWLPQLVESYVQMARQRIVTIHFYSKFQLFSVSSSSVITVPKPPDVDAPAQPKSNY
jgi:hypothetical protein